MQALEFETQIDKDGHIHLPEEFQYAYGKLARLIVLLPESPQPGKPKRQPGSARGVLRILVEDEEHLNDFGPYMP